MHATDIIAYADNEQAEIVCADCARQARDDNPGQFGDDRMTPCFSGYETDNWGESCGWCGERIEGTSLLPDGRKELQSLVERYLKCSGEERYREFNDTMIERMQAACSEHEVPWDKCEFPDEIRATFPVVDRIQLGNIDLWLLLKQRKAIERLVDLNSGRLTYLRNLPPNLSITQEEYTQQADEHNDLVESWIGLSNLLDDIVDKLEGAE